MLNSGVGFFAVSVRPNFKRVPQHFFFNMNKYLRFALKKKSSCIFAFCNVLKKSPQINKIRQQFTPLWPKKHSYEEIK